MQNIIVERKIDDLVLYYRLHSIFVKLVCTALNVALFQFQFMSLKFVLSLSTTSLNDLTRKTKLKLNV